MRVNYAVIFVSDMKRSIAFYRAELQLPLKFETSHWTEFATEGSTMALHLSELPNPDGDAVQDETGGRCRPGVAVPDLDAFHQRMIERGVPCLQAPKDVFGARIAQYVDPDGLVLAVSQDSSQR